MAFGSSVCSFQAKGAPQLQLYQIAVINTLNSDLAGENNLDSGEEILKSSSAKDTAYSSRPPITTNVHLKSHAVITWQNFMLPQN